MRQSLMRDHWRNKEGEMWQEGFFVLFAITYLWTREDYLKRRAACQPILVPQNKKKLC